MKNSFSSIVVITTLMIGGYFVSDSFAVDYRDSSGYTPSWAISQGYHYVLNECNYLIGNTSRDGNWCYEWVAYVLDQGVENFPESTKSTSSPKSFVLEDGPLYSGHLTNFLPDKSHYGSDWQVGKPFTVENLDQLKSAGVIDFVSQRMVIPDIWDKTNFLSISFIIMKLENTKDSSQFYSKVKETIHSQNFPNAEEYFELEAQGIYGDKFELEKSSKYFVADCVGQVINYLQENEEAKLTCIKENYIVAVMVSQKTDLYNTSYTGGGPESSVYDYSEIIIGNIIDEAFQNTYGEKSGIVSIKDEASCLALVDKAEWHVDNFGNGNCMVEVLNIDSGETLSFSRGSMIMNSNTIFKNSGTLNVLGTEDTWGILDTWGTFENEGTINISGDVGIQEGSFINKGTININEHGTLLIFSKGTLKNYGTINNNDQLINHGTINNYCNGLILGNPVGMKEFGVGKNPIKQISCDNSIQETTNENTPNDKNIVINVNDPNKYTMVEKLSTYFIKNNSNQFWITNEKRSETDYLQTTYDILKTSNDQKIGKMIFNAHRNEFTVHIWTDYDMSNPGSSSEITVDFANHIQQAIREGLFSDCTQCIDDHAKIWKDNIDSHETVRNYANIGEVDVVMIMRYADNEKGEFGQIFEFPDLRQNNEDSSEGGGCLIATATYGSELAPQVQQLRELRDNKLLQTESGTSFMNTFNDFYYSFSPTIADFERENPIFKEMVKIAITPMLSSLSIMSFADDSEISVLSLGISVIALNLGIYVIGPVVGISKIKSYHKK